MSADIGSEKKWLAFLRERSPLAGLLAVGASQSLSSHYLFRTGFHMGALIASTAGVAGLLLLMRFADEAKDYAKDLVAHPERPLPRGLISPDEMRRGIHFLAAVLLAYAALLAFLFSPAAGALYAATTGYALLMYREFFMPRLLNVNAFFYALTHQVIVLPMYAFSIAVAASPAAAWSEQAFWFALTGLGASFTYEISRKLDPSAHPVLMTYLRLYGRSITMFALTASLALLSVAAYRLGVHLIVWPFVVLTALAVAVLFRRPEKFKAAENAAAALALVQMLAPTVRHVLRALS